MQTEIDLLKTNKAYTQIARTVSRRESFPHAVLLIGADERALTGFARFIARALMCEQGADACGRCPACVKVANNTHADVLSYPKEARSILVEDALEITDTMHILPYEGGKKVYIINLGASANAQSQNKLLKSLEEPARDVIFILTTTNESTVLATIKSRAVKFYVHNFGNDAIERFLNQTRPDDAGIKLASIYSGGNLSSATKLCADKNLTAKLDLVFGLLTQMTHSSNCLKFVERLQKEKSDFGGFIQLFNVVVGLALSSACGAETNDAAHANEYQQAIAGFGRAGLGELIKLGNEVNERLIRNANFNATIDFFVLKILEVRFNAGNSSIR